MTDQIYELSYTDSSTDTIHKCIIQVSNCRHIRITSDEKHHQDIITTFLNKYSNQIVYYVFASEISKEGVAHIHGHIEWKILPKKQTLSDYFKKQQLSGKYYHQQLDKPVINNLLYVTKDLKIIAHNFPEEAIQKIKQQTLDINEDKKLSTRHKLLELFKTYIVEQYNSIINPLDGEPQGLTLQHRELQRPGVVVHFIHNTYVKSWDKPPHLSSMKQTALYIMQKVTDDESIPISYQDAITNFYEKYIGLF